MIFVVCFYIRNIISVSDKCATGELILSERTSINDNEYEGCSGFTGSLKLPNTLITIGQYAFYSCSGFSGDLIIPNSVTTIGSHAFEGCIGFNGQLVLPDTLSQIGDFAFYSCNNLAGVLNIPSNLESIGQNAFVNTNFDLVTYYGTSLQCDITVFDKAPKCEVSEEFHNHTLCGLTITSRKENSPKGSPLSVGLIVVIVLGSLVVLHIIVITIVLCVRGKNAQNNSSTGEDISRVPIAEAEPPNTSKVTHYLKSCEHCREKCPLCFGANNNNAEFAHICERHSQENQVNRNECYFCREYLSPEKDYHLARLCQQCALLCGSSCIHCYCQQRNKLQSHLEKQAKLRKC